MGLDASALQKLIRIEPTEKGPKSKEGPGMS
jgi:hypothetical protein